MQWSECTAILQFCNYLLKWKVLLFLLILYTNTISLKILNSISWTDQKIVLKYTILCAEGIKLDELLDVCIW